MARPVIVKVIDVGTPKPVDPKTIRNKEQRLAANDRKLREKLVPAPPHLEKGDESQWVVDRLAALEPWAIRELEEQLLYSRDSRERRSAADKIIDANGHGKREAQAGNAPIMVVMNVQPGQMPWHQTVNGQVTTNAKIAANERRPLPSGKSSKGSED